MWIPLELKPKVAELSSSLPFIIHGDTTRNTLMAYPTHTHGLDSIGIPEIFINHSAFGVEDNAFVINLIAIALMLQKDILEKFKLEGFLEDRSGMLKTEKHDPVLCLRKVDSEFLAIIKAYPNCEPPENGYAQLYVKGDDHVLKEDYYVGIPDGKNTTEV